MGLFHSPSIVTEDLILCYDAASFSSYSGTGSTFFDISGNSKNASLINSPTYSNENFGKINTNGIDEYIQIDNISTPTRSRTVNIIYKLNNPGSGWGPLWRVQDWRERIFPTTAVIIPDSLTYYYLNGPTPDTNIQNICYSYSGTSLKCYKNGILTDSRTMDSQMSPDNWSYRFGNQSGGSTNAYVNCDYYHISFYNRQLSDQEVFRNFNVLQNRFGL